MATQKKPGDRIRGGIVPPVGATCKSCGRPANFACSCGCGATGCYKCVKEGRIG